MDIAEKTLLLKKDLDDVYNKALDVGRQEGYESGYNYGKSEGHSEGYTDGYSQSESDFWDSVLNGGKRNNVQYLFYQWSCEYIRPKYVVKSHTRTDTYRAIQIFAYNTKLKIVEKKYFDLSDFIPETATGTGCHYGTFDQCTALEVCEDIGLQGGGYYRTWHTCEKLHTIENMRCVADGEYRAVFTNCSELVNITINKYNEEGQGEIGTNITFQYSPKLSTASIVSIIEHLSDTSGATLTLNTNAVNSMVFPYTSPYTNITYNSWDELIATKTNWTISKASA